MIEVELPTGTVTLQFTDIEGSTRMLRSLGEAMTFDQVLGYAAAWTDQQREGGT